MVFIFKRVAFCAVSIILGYSDSESATCGTLKFEKEKVIECQTAHLIYRPDAHYAERKWYKEQGKKAEAIYDHTTIHGNSKYIESEKDGNVILSISAVNSKDDAAYIIKCAERRFTKRSYLYVTANPTGPGCHEKCGKLSVLKSNIIEGDPVSFYFYVEIGKAVTWEKNESTTFKQLEGTKYTNTVIQGYERQSYIISKAKYSDNGEYRVNCGDTVSNSVYLNIDYSRPTDPEFSDVKTELYCKSGGCILATVGKPAKVECFVKGGSEPLELIMLKNAKEIANASQKTKEKNRTTFHYVKYNFTPTKSDIDATFTCRVKNPALTVPSATSVLVYIKVTPNKIDFILNEVKEGKQSEIQCVSMNGRPPLKSDLYIGSLKEHDTEMNSETVAGDLHTVTTSATKAFSRYQNQVKIKCCSTVGDGICNETNINVLFPPKNVTVQEISNQNEENGDTMITLKFAVAESNPRSYVDINGLKHVQPKLVSEKYEPENNTNGLRFTAIWTFNFTRHYNMKELTCEVQNDGFPDLELSSIYKLNITYYPIVTISEKEQKTVYVGDDIELVCSVDSNPPSTLSWHNHAGIIKEIFEADTIELHLTNVSSDHSQTYSCKANNGIGGTVSKDITVIVKDPSEKPEVKAFAESNIASVFGPIIGCTFVILIAIYVAFILRKRRQNAQADGGNIREINIEETNASLHPTGNEQQAQINMATSSGNAVAVEQPEYARVIPKKDRGTYRANKEANDTENKNNERGDNLVYADLDLAEYPDLAAKRPLVTMHEQTEYVSIDFSKTGAAAIADSYGDEN